jgi:hypothetical protein
MGRNWCHLYQLFSLGLEFSFKKLMKVGGTALLRSHPDYRYGIDGFLVGTWMAGNKWTYFPWCILSFPRPPLF